MGKRSDFEKREKDQYLTPEAAVLPLLPFLPRKFTFAEPCAGDGRLICHLKKLTNSSCTYCSDISPSDYPNPRYAGINEKDALEITDSDLKFIDFIITNPPWTRTKASGYLLHEMIAHFSDLRPTWLLFDADWMHTVQAAPYIQRHLLSVVSIGRVKWIEDSNMSGKDNCAWYLFDKDARMKQEFPTFFGRKASGKNSDLT